MKTISLVSMVFWVLIFQSTQAQQTSIARQLISGTIREEGTGNPVRNISVFFEGTLNGTVSDSAGNFTLYPKSTIKLPILISGMGYYSQTITEYATDKKLLVNLKLHAYDLDVINVTANDGMSRKEKIRIFKREFLGSSLNARSCEIQNEDDLRFTYNAKTKTLKATCDKPLIIYNKNLGYTLNFLLASFTHTSQQTAFSGSPFFREAADIPDSAKVSRTRRYSYLGSQMHFIRALWANKLGANGFAVVKNTRNISYDSLVVAHGDQKYLNLSEPTYYTVTYRSQLSYMQSNFKNMVLDKNGYIDPLSLVWTGEIGRQRAGDLLPLDYEIDGTPGDKDELASLNPAAARSQNGGIQRIITSMDTLRARMPAEKLYVQFDKPYYISGDTIRMKAYLFDAALLKASEKSGIVYVELANDTNKVLFRRMLPVGYGLGTGNIILNREDIPEGSYTIRAYTNLMRNFGEDLVFKKDLYVSGNSSRNWLVNSQSVLSKQGDKDNLRLALQFKEFNQKALAMRELDLRILDGKKVLQRDKVKTDITGNLDVNFNLPEKMQGNKLSLVAADSKDDTRKITIPIPVNRDENIDLQFMPEGGNLVVGIKSLVGFKATGEDGRGTDVSGKIFSGDLEVTDLNSSYKGMGSFELTPNAGETYTAKLTLANGTKKVVSMPAVKTAGAVLRVINTTAEDSIHVAVSTTGTTNAVYYLIAQSRGIICYGGTIRVNGNTTNTRKIAKSLFPTGITRFTLMTADRQPLNERIIFIDHHDQLNIAVKPSKALYQTRDSISLSIEVVDQEGNPIQGSFSVGVTDNSQVRVDSLGSNLLTSLLLTSDLKGAVEDPAHYFQETTQAPKDLDHLLLTQGWVGYDPAALGWKDLLNPPTPGFAAEPEFVVKGRVSNVFSKGISTAPVQLLSLRPATSQIGLADKDGLFRFAGLPVADSLQFFIQARNKKEKSTNVGIEVEEFQPPLFVAANLRVNPWFLNSDTVLIRQVKTQIAQEEFLKPKGTNLLETVTITGKKIVRDSKNLNGPGESDQALDEKDMAKDPKKSLMDLMKERIKGFGMGIWPTSYPPPAGIPPVGYLGLKGTADYLFHPIISYKIYDKELHLVIDGVDVEQFYKPSPGTPMNPVKKKVELLDQLLLDPSGDYVLERNRSDPMERRDFIEQYLVSLSAEDIRGIEILSSPQYNSRYKSAFAMKSRGSVNMITNDFAYAEVTTRSGNGAFLKTMPGTYLFKPMPYVNSTSFYRPKYVLKTNPIVDMRSVIHWEPDVLTNQAGKASVSFYAADRPGTYSIILEGSDMNGNIGRQTGFVTIK